MKKERRWLKRVIKEAEELNVAMPWAHNRPTAPVVSFDELPTARCA